MRFEELILYRNFKRQDILDDLVALLSVEKAAEALGNASSENASTECMSNVKAGIENASAEKLNTEMASVSKTRAEGARLFANVASRLLSLAEDYGFSGNLWHCFLAYLLCNNENSYSCACEIRGGVNGSINEFANHDMQIFKEAFETDLSVLKTYASDELISSITDYVRGDKEGKVFNKRIRDRICNLAVALAKCADVSTFKATVEQFYHDFGVGRFGLNKAFRLKLGENSTTIEPITNMFHVQLSDLVGYDIAKEKLIANTEAFIAGKPANNCLLYGSAGTGKSTCIKAISNMYYEKGLRIIEVYKHQFKALVDVIAEIKDRNYKFILYMDDLSFEEFEIDYKYLKAVIEGGLEKKPDNVLIYATSNRRHLIRETFRDKNDRDEELHTNDTVQEKLSLANRFGVSIYFGRPDKFEFQKIVRALADKAGIEMEDEKLFLEANKWELSHGGLSGRCAQQFVDYLLGKE